MTAVPALSKLDAPSPRHLLRGLHREFANWYLLGPLSWVVLPSRCPPRGGIGSLASKDITVKIRGGDKANCRIDEFFSFVEIFVLREYDIPGVPWIELRTIVDVGANVGAATLWFARKAPWADIVAVEPGSRPASVLRTNIRSNGLDARVRVVAVALADRSGTVALSRPASSVFGTITSEKTSGAEEVRALSLEDLLGSSGLDEVDLLKLDCEGAEFDVLLSSNERVLRRIRFIVGEYHSTSRSEIENLIARLEDVGFRSNSSGSDSLGLFQAVRAE